jgi:hypothetical protein
LRDLFASEKSAKNTQSHIEFLTYLKPYIEFENFTVDEERVRKSNQQKELELMSEKLGDKVESLKEWAQNNIMDKKAIEVVNFIKLFEAKDKLSKESATELTLLAEKLNERIFETKPQLEKNKKIENVLPELPLENPDKPKELLSLPTMDLIIFPLQRILY